METTGLEQKPPGLHRVWKATQDRDLSTQQTGLKPSEVQKFETVCEGWDESILAWERERPKVRKRKWQAPQVEFSHTFQKEHCEFSCVYVCVCATQV